ncbi:hypothetical protein Q8A67_020944 [Cirrhinus molitorella]|uniref:Uncharacterized protein n=1 Tax=Cirrhinus molitorella TaxID=172907 RepID=A0AA88P656_9TELE|nr:hypothetical protein Q8A67_020944 [Cirrhinus molitorella]
MRKVPSEVLPSRFIVLLELRSPCELKETEPKTSGCSSVCTASMLKTAIECVKLGSGICLPPYGEVPSTGDANRSQTAIKGCLARSSEMFKESATTPRNHEICAPYRSLYLMTCGR